LSLDVPEFAKTVQECLAGGVGPFGNREGSEQDSDPVGFPSRLRLRGMRGREEGEGESGQQGKPGEPHEVPLSIGRRVAASLAFTLPLSPEEGDRVSRGAGRSRRAEVRAPPGSDVSEYVGDSRVHDPV
jgi:hypothetical protein